MLKKTLLVLASLLIALALAEGALRIFGHRPQLSSSWILLSPRRVLDEDVLTVNREFLSDDFYSAVPADGSTTRMIAAIGDSYTMGFPVKPKDAYPKVLERTLRERAYDVTVLNFGMGDTGSDQHLRLFTKYVLPRAKPDIVIWQFSVNDCYDNAIKPLFEVSEQNQLVPLNARGNWMYRRQRMLLSAPLPSSFKKSSYLFHLILSSYEDDRESQVPVGQEPIEWGFRKIPLEVARMNELAAQNGFQVYYVLISPPRQYGEARQPPSTVYRGLHTILEKEPGFIPTRFQSASPDEGIITGLFADSARDPNPPGHRHFNEAGYAKFADMIADRLLADRASSE